jgi:hypothetical protein
VRGSLVEAMDKQPAQPSDSQPETASTSVADSELAVTQLTADTSELKPQGTHERNRIRHAVQQVFRMGHHCTTATPTDSAFRDHGKSKVP